MKKGDKIIVLINGMELTAVLIEYKRTEINVWENTYTKEYIFYYQNKIARQICVFVTNPNDITPDGYVDSITDILVEYCVIPEYDDMLKIIPN